MVHMAGVIVLTLMWLAAAPAQAYAWPAFPADSVIAPRARASAGRVAIRLVMPRALNEPVSWRCSAFR